MVIWHVNEVSFIHSFIHSLWYSHDIWAAFTRNSFPGSLISPPNSLAPEDRKMRDPRNEYGCIHFLWLTSLLRTSTSKAWFSYASDKRRIIICARHRPSACLRSWAEFKSARQRLSAMKIVYVRSRENERCLSLRLMAASLLAFAASRLSARAQSS